MSPQDDLIRRLVEKRRDAFGATTAKTPPYPSRLASPLRLLIGEHYGTLLGIACLLAAFALMLEPV